MRTIVFSATLGLLLAAAVGAEDSADFRAPLHLETAKLADAAAELSTLAASRVRPENAVRKRILGELEEYASSARQLSELTASASTRRRAFQLLGRVNTLAGYLAADLPRSGPFAMCVEPAQKAQDALDRVNAMASGWFGALAPSGRVFRYARELADKASAMPGRVRAAMVHSGRRHTLVQAFEEFAAHARAYAASLGDPLVTEAGQANRLALLFRHADRIDLALVQTRATASVRSVWNGMRDSLRMLWGVVGKG
ncbi:MAG: hypothetical protein HYY25_05545 [Candidatus Wallbacteria bacterium]|nr:hypothetical protein [Candidatus Wallbacteria bacterium]